jgi:hypothetical protein
MLIYRLKLIVESFQVRSLKKFPPIGNQNKLDTDSIERFLKSGFGGKKFSALFFFWNEKLSEYSKWKIDETLKKKVSTRITNKEKSTLRFAFSVSNVKTEIKSAN